MSSNKWFEKVFSQVWCEAHGQAQNIKGLNHDSEGRGQRGEMLIKRNYSFV